MSIKLEVGKFYVNRKGDKVGPMMFRKDNTQYPFYFLSITYTELGGVFLKEPYDLDLVSEWVEPKVEPELTPFGKLTPEKQGALLLAHHNGETIQSYSGPSQSWTTMILGPAWFVAQPYRVKPKVKMQPEYWVVFTKLGIPKYVTINPSKAVFYGEYKVHHPAVEMRETT